MIDTQEVISLLRRILVTNDIPEVIRVQTLRIYDKIIALPQPRAGDTKPNVYDEIKYLIKNNQKAEAAKKLLEVIANPNTDTLEFVDDLVTGLSKSKE